MKGGTKAIIRYGFIGKMPIKEICKHRLRTVAIQGYNWY
jgi:hypothetical protein